MLRWEDEDFVKLYTRETAESIDRGWEARALLHELMRKVDKAGILQLGRRGPVAIAGIVRMPEEVVLRAFDVLVEDGTVERIGTHIVLVNFPEAQAARSSDKLRKAQERARARDVARASGEGSEVATAGPSISGDEEHEESRGVTDGHAGSRQVTREERREEREERGVGQADELPQPVVVTKPKRGRGKSQKTSLPSTWQPTADLVRWARNDVDVAFTDERVGVEAKRFRTKAEADGWAAVNWDAKFKNWLLGERKYHPDYPRALPVPDGPPPDAPPMRPAIAEAAAQLSLDPGRRDFRDALKNFGTLNKEP